jgi:membrane fusion protein (multidrug efflux system)
MDSLATQRAGFELAQAEAAATHQRTLTEIAHDLDTRRLSARIEVVTAEAGMKDQQLNVQRAGIEVERLGAASTYDHKAQAARIVELRRQLTELQAEQQAREAAVSLARAQLSRLQVCAPVNGVIGSIAALQVGDVVKAGEVVATIIPARHVHMVAEFAPSDAAGRVERGKIARVRLNGFAWIEFGVLSAQVTQVASEPRNGTVRVELQLGSESGLRVPVQHGLPGTVDVLVDSISPLQLVLRSIGTALTPAPSNSQTTEALASGVTP